MRAVGATDVVLEASSHALEQGRLDGCAFRVAALTNLTQDHLDYHGTMDEYFERQGDPVRAAASIRTRGVAVTFVDDEAGRRMRARAPSGARARRGARARARGARRRRRGRARDARTRTGRARRFATPVGRLEIASPLVGELQPRQPGAGGRDGDRARAARATRSWRARRGSPACRGGSSGWPTTRGVLCVVDYAHTPDALERAIAAMRPLVAPGGG